MEKGTRTGGEPFEQPGRLLRPFVFACASKRSPAQGHRWHEYGLLRHAESAWVLSSVA